VWVWLSWKYHSSHEIIPWHWALKKYHKSHEITSWQCPLTKYYKSHEITSWRWPLTKYINKTAMKIAMQIWRQCSFYESDRHGELSWKESVAVNSHESVYFMSLILWQVMRDGVLSPIIFMRVKPFFVTFFTLTKSPVSGSYHALKVTVKGHMKWWYHWTN
jgi:hypothetical protein